MLPFTQMLEFLKIFFVILIDEIGDKTQLATLGFSATHNKWLTFAASATALIITSFVASILGGWLQGKVNPKYLTFAAGALFILIGTWTIFAAFRTK